MAGGRMTGGGVWGFLGSYGAFVVTVLAADVYHRKVTMVRMRMLAEGLAGIDGDGDGGGGGDGEGGGGGGSGDGRVDGNVTSSTKTASPPFPPFPPFPPSQKPPSTTTAAAYHHQNLTNFERVLEAFSNYDCDGRSSGWVEKGEEGGEREVVLGGGGGIGGGGGSTGTGAAAAANKNSKKKKNKNDGSSNNSNSMTANLLMESFEIEDGDAGDGYGYGYSGSSSSSSSVTASGNDDDDSSTNECPTSMRESVAVCRRSLVVFGKEFMEEVRDCWTPSKGARGGEIIGGRK